MSSASMPPPPPPLPKQSQETTSAESKRLIPILIVIGGLMCGCIAIPLLAGGAMLLYVSSARDAQRARAEFDVDQIEAINLPGGGTFGPGTNFDSPPLGGAYSGDALGSPNVGGGKEVARLNLQNAEQALKIARGHYEAMQGVYEQQRDFQAQQAGRLGAQGIRLSPPQPPDPQLYQNVLAAEAQYEAAKAAFDAAP